MNYAFRNPNIVHSLCCNNNQTSLPDVFTYVEIFHEIKFHLVGYNITTLFYLNYILFVSSFVLVNEISFNTL